jgi:hypothetical protein
MVIYCDTFDSIVGNDRQSVSRGNFSPSLYAQMIASGPHHTFHAMGFEPSCNPFVVSAACAGESSPAPKRNWDDMFVAQVFGDRLPLLAVNA